MKATTIQRKCACGGACDSCNRKKQPPLQRSALSTVTPAVPAAALAAVRVPGNPLDAATRASFEARFGHSFADVRVHTDANAARAAESIHAAAYTSGSHIVFGSGRYEPHSGRGQRLLAHELTHSLDVSSPADASEREADAVADRVVRGGLVDAASIGSAAPHLARVPIAPTTHQAPNPAQPMPSLALGRTPDRVTPGPLEHDPARILPVRGPNPAAAMPSCDAIATLPLQAASLRAAADRWRDDAIAALVAAGPASNASHHAEILANERVELAEEITTLNATTLPPAGYRDRLATICRRKTREIEIEYRYNVILSNAGAHRWGDPNFGELDNMESALRGIPPESTWGNPVVLTFLRQAVHAAGSNVGGETQYERGQGQGSIDMFDSGMNSSAFMRGMGTSVPVHDVRHEVGHVVQLQVPEPYMQELWKNIMDWRRYSLAWITPRNAPYASWTEERNAVKRETGITDDDAFDAWLNALQMDGIVVANGREWAKENASGAPTLYSWKMGAIPHNAEFAYARTQEIDYFSEVYAHALSAPEWLHDRLPDDQIEWLKRRLFRFPATRDEWARELPRAIPSRRRRSISFSANSPGNRRSRSSTESRSRPAQEQRHDEDANAGAARAAEVRLRRDVREMRAHGEVVARARGAPFARAAA
jgi:hypothetical protein